MVPDVPEISPRELAARLEAGGPLQVLDVRAPSRLAAGRIDVVPAEQFFNVPNSRLFGSDPAAVGLATGRLIAVVCGHGNSSRQAAAYLRGHGLDAFSLSGGMAAWMRLVVPRELPAPAGFDKLVQMDRVGKGALGYLLAAGGEALAVDPPRDASAFLAEAARTGARLVAVADTHAHADYLSGGPGLARELSIPYFLHPADAVSPYDGSPARLPFSPVTEGTEIRLGAGRIGVRHTPGHTAGSVTYGLGQTAALTGDFLFVGSIGRPDLGGRQEAWTGELWQSLERARREWPPDLLILPAHYAGAAERRPDRAVGAPFGELAGRNPALAIRERERFASWVADRCGPCPDAYPRIKTANLGLLEVGDEEAEELEGGRNECALGG